MRGQLLHVLVVVAAGCGRLDFGAGDDRPHPDSSTTTIVDPPIDPAGCAALPASCGPSRNQSCCDSPLVPGGTFARSFDMAPDNMFPSASDGATVSSFRLDKYEVTVGRFRQFVVAGHGTRALPPAPAAGARPTLPGSGWDSAWNASLAADSTALVTAFRCDGAYFTWTDMPDGSKESRPMNCVSWLEAMAFCTWDGGYLPTEAEWNYAAAGGPEQRAYPWSNPAPSTSIDDTRTSYFVNAVEQCGGDGVNGCTPDDILVVGTKPAGDGKWGHSDLGGNVWEWTLDWFASPYTQHPCDNCADLTPTTTRAIRGGSYDIVERYHRSGRRLDLAQTGRQANIGFRCARPAAP